MATRKTAGPKTAAQKAEDKIVADIGGDVIKPLRTMAAFKSLIETLIAGLDVKHRPATESGLRESFIVRKEGKTTAQILVQKSGSLRLNLKSVPPGMATLTKKAGVRPTRSGAEWAAWAPVDETNAAAVRELLAKVAA